MLLALQQHTATLTLAQRNMPTDEGRRLDLDQNRQKNLKDASIGNLWVGVILLHGLHSCMRIN